MHGQDPERILVYHSGSRLFHEALPMNAPKLPAESHVADLAGCGALSCRGAKMSAFKYELSVWHSPAPGCDWDAWIGFKPLSKGFSILAKYSGNGVKPVRIARSSRELSWRTACQALLQIEECWHLGDDFLEDTLIKGLSGWRANLLASCWFGGEYIHRREVAMLCRQDEETLETMNRGFQGGLLGNQCLATLSAAAELFGKDVRLSDICKGAISADELSKAVKAGLTLASPA